MALLFTTLVCGLLFRLAGHVLQNREALDALGYIPMGLSLFLTFVCCNFTETDRRGRFEGFPSRLFTLPVPTRTLVAAPILFSVLAVGVIYAVWAKVALPALGLDLPLSWPSLYLATGMVCYQAIVWSLARFRIARLLVLGVCGSAFAVGWIALRNGFERELIFWLVPDTLPVRPVLCAILVVITLGAFVVAHISVESQRRGGGSEWQGLRRFIELTTDLLPRRQQRFRSPGHAQFWFEWRRHGILLPVSTLAVLLLIIAPAPFLDEPINASTTTFTIGWILFLPLLLAFALGKGFGKADLWSKEPGLPIFVATRPLNNTGWIAAKMKAAALASLTAWLVVVMLTPWWVCMWCDYKDLIELWWIAERIYPAAVLYALPGLCFGVLVILTWRLLVGSLFVGFSGKTWVLTTAVCVVFTVIFGTPFLILSLTHHPKAFRHLLKLPAWFPWLLAGLFAAKVAAAFLLADHAQRQGWVTGRSIRRYLTVWLTATAFLILAVWLLVPVEGWLKWLFVLLGCFAVPLLSAAYAPIALARNRRR